MPPQSREVEYMRSSVTGEGLLVTGWQCVLCPLFRWTQSHPRSLRWKESMTNTRPVILIGIDAAEIDVLDRMVSEGRLPNLAKLRQEGRSGRLQTEPPHFLSLVWSTFFCSSRL